MWFSQGIAQGKGYEQCAGRTNLLRNFAQQRDRYRCYAHILDGTLNQSHGLVAHGSDRGKQNNSDCTGGKTMGYFWRSAIDELSWPGDGAHEAVMVGSNSSNFATCLHLT